VAVATCARQKAILTVMDVVTPPETTKVGTAQETSRKLAVELIGTFFLVFTGGVSVYSGTPLARWPSARS